MGQTSIHTNFKSPNKQREKKYGNVTFIFMRETNNDRVLSWRDSIVFFFWLFSTNQTGEKNKKMEKEEKEIHYVRNLKPQHSIRFLTL